MTPPDRFARRLAWVELLCLAAALGLFLFTALPQITLPGFYYDEGFDLTPMLNLMHGEPVELLRGIGLHLGSMSLPLMRMDYMGSLNGYLTLPLMALLGPGVLAARLEPIFFSVVTLILTYVLARRWFGRMTAALTVGLLAASPSFVWFTRQGITVTSVMTVFSLGSWIALDAWRKSLHNESARPAALIGLPVLAGLLLGLGLWAKIIFLWWIVLTGVVTAVWLLTLRGRRLPRAPFRRAAGAGFSGIEVVAQGCLLAALGFLIGAAPFIYYNLAGIAQGQAPPTFALLFEKIAHPTEYGVNNSNFIANLQKRVADFVVFLNGSYFWYQADVPYGNVLAVPAFLISAGAGSLLAIRRPEWRKWLAIALCIAIYLPVSSFTVSALWATHFFVLVPLPQLIVASAAVWLGQAVRARLPRFLPTLASAGLAVCVTLAALAPAFSRDLWVNDHYHQALAKTGGSGRFSDAIYRLTDQLSAQGVAEPIALDWGIAQQIRVLTGDRVRPREIFGFSAEPSQEFTDQVRELLRDPDRRYIVLWDRFAVYNRRSKFTEIAAAQGKQVKETFIAYERSGLPVYIVLQAK